MWRAVKEKEWQETEASLVSRVATLKSFGADFLNAVYFRRGLTCTLGITNDLIDGGQPRAKNGF